jgi:PAS domain S-box-containing protein
VARRVARRAGGDFALSLADILEAHGYQPVLAHDAASAAARQAELRAPVALIDVRLAGGSGLTLLTTLRARHPRMLSVMMTAYADVDSAVLALQKGAYDFLRKPFEAGELLAVLERCFAHTRLDQEKRAAEKALRESEGRYRTLFESAGDGIMITDAHGAIEYVNPAFERITGYARGEVLGKTPRVLKSGAHSEDFYAGLWRTLTVGRTWLGRFSNRRKDGALILEDASISPILDEGGQVQGYVSVKRDVTRQVHLERHLVEAQKMDALGTLAGGIAHDFNNILSAILGSVDLGLRAVEPDSKPARHLGNIRRAALRAAELTR